MASKSNASAPPAAVVKAAQGVQAGLLSLARGAAPSFVHVLDLAMGLMRANLVYVAAELDIAERLKHGARSADELAKEIGCSADALFRLMRALAALALLKETEPRRFKTTRYGKTLERGHPQSTRPFALLVGSPSWARPWSDLLYAVRTGEAASAHVLGKNLFEYYAEHKEEGRLFDEWMTSISQSMDSPAVAAAFPFSRFKHVVDIGGGQGALLSHLLKCNANLRGTLFDAPQVVQNAVLDPEVSGRCEIVAGDFFKSVPNGGDLYLLKTIIHDWDDDRAVQILANCREAMSPGARLLIVDAVIRPGNAFEVPKLLDLHMLVLSGGRERTREEFRSLLQRAGFSLLKVYATASLYDILEAEAASGPAAS